MFKLKKNCLSGPIIIFLVQFMRKQVFIKCIGLDKQNFSAHLFKMGLIVTKPVFEVSDKGRLKPIYSARK